MKNVLEQKCEFFFFWDHYSPKNANSESVFIYGIEYSCQSNLTFSDCIFEYFFLAKNQQKIKNNFYFLIGVSNLTKFLHIYVKLTAESNELY